MHYDFIGGGTVDLRGLSVRAFQRLWNRNHPTDTITEDGIYGGGTASRLSQSPIGGFAKGANCTKTTDAGADADASADAGTEPEDPTSTSPADVPAIPDATEGDSDEPATTSNGPQTRPTPDSSGCSLSPASNDASAHLALAFAAVALVATQRRRRRISRAS